MCAHRAGYGASVECDGSDPLRFAVLTTRAASAQRFGGLLAGEAFY